MEESLLTRAAIGVSPRSSRLGAGNASPGDQAAGIGF
jgi:hypothetical protein